MTDTAIALAPWVQLLQPAVTTIVVGGIGVAFSWIAPTINRWFHLKVTQAQVSILTQRAQTVAGSMIAADAQNLAGKSITVGNPTVVVAANSLAAGIPEAMKITGWNAASIQTLIVGELGKLQAPQPTIQTVAVVAPVAPGSLK